MKFLVLACVDNRKELLHDCLCSLSHLDGWRLMLVGQEFSDERKVEIANLVPSGSMLIWCDEKIGMHNAKRIALQEIDSIASDYVVASIDDDMKFLPITNFDAMAELARRKGVGIVSGNWVRSEKMLMSKKIKPEIVKQHIVYTAGGMIFDSVIARKIIELGKKDYWCDNTEWSLASYLNGYQNMRYLGSLAIHRILSSGGRKSWVSSSNIKLPDPEYISLKRDAKGGYHIPSGSELTSYAKSVHLNKRKTLIT